LKFSPKFSWQFQMIKKGFVRLLKGKLCLEVWKLSTKKKRNLIKKNPNHQNLNFQRHEKKVFFFLASNAKPEKISFGLSSNQYHEQITKPLTEMGYGWNFSAFSALKDELPLSLLNLESLCSMTMPDIFLLVHYFILPMSNICKYLIEMEWNSLCWSF